MGRDVNLPLRRTPEPSLDEVPQPTAQSAEQAARFGETGIEILDLFGPCRGFHQEREVDHGGEAVPPPPRPGPLPLPPQGPPLPVFGCQRGTSQRRPLPAW